MADDVTFQSSTLATPPSGTIVSADAATSDGALVQRMKLAYSADGATTHVTADADGLLVNLGANNDVTVTGNVAITAAALPLPSGASTSAKQDTLQTAVDAVNTKTPSLGQALAAASVPVVLTAAQITTLTPPAAITGFATETKQDTGNTSLSSIDGKITAVNTGAVVVSSSALPSGASTAAKQPALGTAGTPSADVITVQGVTSMTALKVDGSAVTQPVSVATIPSHAVTNAGTFVTQVDGAALTALQLIDDPILADDAAFTPGTTKVQMVGFEADETATDSVDEGDGGAARMTLDRKVITTPQPHIAGGLTIHRSIDLDEGTLEVVKNAPGCLYSMWVANLATSTRFIKFYDATSGTAGTGTPVITVPIPGNSTDDIAGVFSAGGFGITFATGICVGATTGIADNDTGAPGANEVVVNVFFK